MLTVTIGIENATGGMGTAAFIAYLSRLTNVAFTATQYALLSSFMAFGRTVLASPSGWAAEQLGWVQFFYVSTVVAVPGLILLLLLMRLFPPAAAEEQPRSEEHTSELQSLMRISYAVFCLKKTTTKKKR